MNQPYKVNIINSLVFISCGTAAFISLYLAGILYPDVLIPSILGLLLLVMTPGMKNENEVMHKIVYFLTLGFGALIFIMMVQEINYEESSLQKIVVFAIISASSLISTLLYFKIHLVNRARR